MQKKYLYLIFGIIASLAFLGYMTESEAQKMFGYSINIWIVRLIWLIIAISNFLKYKKLKK